MSDNPNVGKVFNLTGGFPRAKFDEMLKGKQDKLAGTQGQVVGFDSDGKAVAQDAPDTGVTTFKGRKGAVMPQTGDYTAEQVGAVPTTRTVNGKPLGGDIILGASDVSALPISGGTLTGNLEGKYITATWFRTTASAHLTTTPPKIPVLDSNGWLYYRTPQELVGDISAATMTQVNEAIETAITGAMNASY